MSMAFSQGLVSGTDIPVEHLDYQYIGKCENATEVEALLKVLRCDVPCNNEGAMSKLLYC